MSKLQDKIYSLIYWQSSLGGLLNLLNGWLVFRRFSFRTDELKSKENYEAFLTKQYHILEKGLALPFPRKNFGLEKINVLLFALEEYQLLYGRSNLINNIAACFKEYLIYSDSFENNFPKLYDRITSFIVLQDADLGLGGTKSIGNLDNENITYYDVLNLFKSRSSARKFNERDVKIQDVRRALEVARNTPSVCNRQGWKAYFISNERMKKELLNLQHGNNGFGQSIRSLLVVTMDTASFTLLEQNQVFIDGGLFSMSLLLGLHASGIDSCPLNTCIPFPREKEIHKILGSRPSERLIMYIGIGYCDANTKVAVSTKKEIETILINKS